MLALSSVLYYYIIIGNGEAKMFIIQAKIPNYLRPCYLNLNQAGQCWSRKATAERFESREAAERFIATRIVSRSAKIEIIEIVK